MRRLDQLELTFSRPAQPTVTGRDDELEKLSRELLRSAGAHALADSGIRVEWNPRMRSAAGRAHFDTARVSLNPQLQAHGAAEIDRTLRHELAHLLAHARVGRRRIQPHGPEWRKACADLGVPDEARCHTLPFPVHRQRRSYLYRCRKCARGFPRVRPIRKRVACLACCREFFGGKFSRKAELRLVTDGSAA